MSKHAAYGAFSKVVSLNGRGRDRSPGVRILAECREQLLERLTLWLRETAATVSEELFILADGTRERLLQTRYLDLRAAIEKDWSPLVETFRRELSGATERCQNPENQHADDCDLPLDLPDFQGLELLADEDLSQHIVIREFAALLSESCAEELYTLKRRVAALLGQDESSDDANPLAPPIVCRALSDACATIVPDSETRLLLLRRLQRHLHLALPPIYQQLNAYLIERGILPELKRSYSRNTAGESSPSTPLNQSAPSNSSLPVNASTAQVATGGANPLSGEDILAALQRLAQARVGQRTDQNSGTIAAPLAPPATAPGLRLDTATINHLLSDSLDELQHAPIAAPGELIINRVRQIRDSENAQGVGGLAAVTIDIVAMLFDFIFDDAHIPLAIKALISRLQIPVLKVAMQNPGFFADRQHPTRRFLGSISGVSIRWGAAVDESDPFYRKLAELVERIQTKFESDVEIFGTALAELEAFVAERQGEEDSTALTAANIVSFREHQSEGWKRAQHAVQTFSADARLPPLIVAFLAEHWVGVLQASAVSDDERGTAWLAAEQAMKDLAWSVAPKKSADDRLKLITLLPTLLAFLNRGLASVNTSAAQCSAFFDELLPYHAAALKGEALPLPAAPAAAQTDAGQEPPAAAAEGDLLVTRSVDHGVEVEEVMLVGASPIWRADEREIHRQVSELKRGDWVEFGEANRERLNWISPQRGILLFSNHRSAKAISIAPDALARQIRDGKACIVREEAIFERALSGALESANAG
jgi:hypothetical protein